MTLTDHIGFAIERFKDGMDFSNALYREIRRFYPREFGVGMYALKLIEERTGIQLPEDEAASIAIHLVDAEFDIKVREAWKITEMMKDMVQILEKELHLPPEDSLNRDRLISNLKLLAHRMLLLEPSEGEADEVFYEFIRRHCVREYSLTQKLTEYLKGQYQCEMTEEERIFLTLQLKQAGSCAEVARRRES